MIHDETHWRSLAQSYIYGWHVMMWWETVEKNVAHFVQKVFSRKYFESFTFMEYIDNDYKT